MIAGTLSNAILGLIGPFDEVPASFYPRKFTGPPPPRDRNSGPVWRAGQLAKRHPALRASRMPLTQLTSSNLPYRRARAAAQPFWSLFHRKLAKNDSIPKQVSATQPAFWSVSAPIHQSIVTTTECFRRASRYARFWSARSFAVISCSRFEMFAFSFFRCGKCGLDLVPHGPGDANKIRADSICSK